MLYYLLTFWNYVVLSYFIIVNGTYLVLVIVAFFAIRKYMKRSNVIDDKTLFRKATSLKPISILAPAYNEEQTVIENLTSLLKINYPQYEIILINDGSQDNTLKKVVEHFGMESVQRANPANLKTKHVRGIYVSPNYPNLVVLDKENGGKADALNAGINVSRFPFIIGIDTDSLLEQDVLLKMIRPFLDRPETVAVGGVVRIINGCEVENAEICKVKLPRSPLPIFQIIEYFRAFLFGRVGWEALNMLLIISGAFGMFQKWAVVMAGGYRTDTVGEDMDLIVRLHRILLEKKIKYHISFVPEPVCWTEAPDTLDVLKRQRNRWHRGLMETLLYNKVMMFNPAFGRIGMFALPFAFFVEGLGPITEVTGLISLSISLYLGHVDPIFVMSFMASAILMGIVMSAAALIVEDLTFRRYPSIKMSLILFLFSVLENFGYRQLNVWWRFMGIYDLLRKKKSWGKMTRTGFSSKKTS